MAYDKYKDLERRTQSGVYFKNKALKIASNPKNNGSERGLASMVYKFFDKKSKGSSLKKSTVSLLESLKKEKCILLLRIIFGVLI